MIGIDIVDLSTSFKKYSILDYSRRILSDKESWINLDSHYQLALLWSIKEASYKCYSKLVSVEFYNPKHIEIVKLNQKEMTFSVHIFGYLLNGWFDINENYIISIVLDEWKDRNDTIARVMQLDERNELEVVYLTEQFNSMPEFIKDDSNRVDEFLSLDRSYYPFSRSHDGSYYAFVTNLRPVKFNDQLCVG